MTRRIFIIFIPFINILLLLFIVAGCGKEEEPAQMEDHVCADVTVITPLSGLGDNGYNDEALAGLLDAAATSGLEVSLLRPRTPAEAREYARRWSEEDNSQRRLLVLPDTEYSSLLSSVETSGGKSVLLFENDGKDVPAGVATFRISRYGTAYLSGCLAKDSETVHIIQGKRGEKIAEEAAAGFAEGYKKSRIDGRIAVHALSDGFTGWSMPDSAYRIASEYPEDFFFPLARGSNAGVYKFSRESPFVLMLIAGMDVDCSLYSKRVPFSVIIDVRRVVKDYVTRWAAGENISGAGVYGMKEGVSSVKLSTLFYEINDIWDSYYDDPAYWESICAAHYDEAIRKEAEYEAKH